MVRRYAAAVGLAVLVFGCGGDWFKGGAPEGVELLVEDLEVPEWADWGETITVTNTVRNWGTTRVDVAFTVNFYLSSDGTYDGGDVLLASRQIDPPFDGGATDTEDTSLTLPGSGTEGPYYIIAYVDEANVVDEIEGGEDDNVTAAGPMDVYDPPGGIDLITKAVSGPTGAEWGDLITVDYTVRNRGTVACTSAFDIDFHLSADQIWDGGVIDPLFGTDSGIVLAAQSESSGTASVSLPGLGTDGYYYIIGVASTTGSDTEIVVGAMPNDKTSDETIYVANLSDLTVSSLTSGSSYYWGDQASINVQIREGRGYPSPPGTQIQVQLWLSENTTIEAVNDQLLTTLVTTPLSALESRNLSTNVTLTKKAGWTGTSYYVIAYVDPLDAILEDNEGNNTRTRALTIDDAPTDPYEPNNTRSTATALGSTPQLTRYAYIQPSGDEDWFSFTIPYSGYYYIWVFLYPPATEDYDLYVYQGTTLIGSSVSPGGGVSESITQTWGHAAGTYYIQVRGKTGADFGSSTYRLDVDIW